ncbi:MAG: Octanoyltransferase LipM [Planctomycetota bacterium]|jgi:lipoate-protein ligase A
MNSAATFPDADVLIDPRPMTGAFNMAMDAALLELVARRSRSVLRIYQWCEPTVTLGYFQAAESGLVSSANPFPELPAVRRLSGGGAILHHHELTYSCVLPDSHPIREEPSSLYVLIHRALIELLAECGAPAGLRSEIGCTEPIAAEPAITNPPAQRNAEPFLCFLRSNPNDIVSCSGPKLVGSAQRRRRGAILQHGSILLRSSPFAPQLPGLQDLHPEFLVSRFTEHLPTRIAEVMSCRWAFREVVAEEIALAEQFLRGTPAS